MKGPLDGLVVLDLSRILAGPTCTQLLGDLGADIIKVERPREGDDTRQWAPPFIEEGDGAHERSAYFLCANRNKRSISVNLSTPDGAELIRRLAVKADVLIENYKVGGLAKYGLDYPTLASLNRRLVYCSITGFGQTGPNAKHLGYDALIQAMGGIMSLTGEPNGDPMKVGVGIADVVCGLYAANAIQAALRAREITNRGQYRHRFVRYAGLMANKRGNKLFSFWAASPTPRNGASQYRSVPGICNRGRPRDASRR